MPTPESDRAARRRLVWLLLTRGDVGAEALRTDGLRGQLLVEAKRSRPRRVRRCAARLLIEGRSERRPGRAVFLANCAG